MTLDKRKLEILTALINNYIITGEPVGSRTISKQYDLGVSSATIRNEMADLEDLGLLVQPHTSAGRIPSDKGYRFYVNEVLPLLEEEILELRSINSNLNQEVNYLEDLLKNAVKTLSTETNYMSMALTPPSNKKILKKIQVIKIEKNKFMILFVSDSGKTAQSNMFTTDEDISEDELLIINKILNENLKRTEENEMFDMGDEKIYRSSLMENILINEITPVITDYLSSPKDVELYFEGISNILNFPEHKDIEKAKEMLDFVEDEQNIFNLLIREEAKTDLDIKIGSENEEEEMKESTIITATYKFNGNAIGKIGILGPKRMDYYKIIRTLKSVSRELNNVFRKT